MPAKYSGCFSRNCSHDDEDESDNAEGYYRLESRVLAASPHDRDGGADVNEGDENDYFKPLDSYQGNSAQPKRAKRRPDTYTDVDMRGKRLSKKLRRKEMRKRIRHFFHSTWKWFKRGLITITPNMASMFMLAPSPVQVITTEAARRQAAKNPHQTPVYL